MKTIIALSALLVMGALAMACGDGGKIIEVAQAFPQSRFVGYDISEDGISAGKELPRANTRPMREAVPA